MQTCFSLVHAETGPGELILVARSRDGNAGVDVVLRLPRPLRWTKIGAVETQQLVREYENKTGDELLRLALDSAQLTAEASTALNMELSKRQLDRPETLESFRQEEFQRQESVRRELGKLWFAHSYGFGRWHFGKAEYSYSPENGIEQFKTTVFLVLLGCPLIPTGTFRVARKRGSFLHKLTVTDRLPLDWEQVLKVWLATVSTFLFLIWAVKLFPRLLLK